MLRDWRASICLGSRVEEEGVLVVGGVGEDVGEEAGETTGVAGLVAFVVVAAEVVVETRRRRNNGNTSSGGGGGSMMNRERVLISLAV